MHVCFRAPAPPLAPYVKGYLVLEDLAGTAAGQEVLTCPEPAAVLAVNFAKGAVGSDGRPHPPMSLLGLQERVRVWRPQDESRFVAAFLTIRGVLSLFPGRGRETVNALVALEDLVDHRTARDLKDSVDDSMAPVDLATALEGWIARRLEAGPVPTTDPGVLELLLSTRSVRETSARAGFGIRTLQRVCREHLGLCPRTLLQLDRLRASVAALQGPEPCRFAGADLFADQAHQIRTWRRFLGLTPARYLQTGPTALAQTLAQSADHREDRAVFWL